MRVIASRRGIRWRTGEEKEQARKLKPGTDNLRSPLTRSLACAICVQHHTFPNACHSTREDFEKQQYRDRLKVTLCRQHGVTLLIVPSSVTRLGMKDHLARELTRLGFPLVSVAPEAEVSETEKDGHNPIADAAGSLTSNKGAHKDVDAEAVQLR